MTDTLCTCGQPTNGNAYLCASCSDDYARALGDVPAIVGELDLTLSKQRRFVVDESGATITAAALPYDVAASNVLAEMMTELIGQVRLCIEQRVKSRDYRDREPGSSFGTLSRWLLWRVDGVAGMPWAADMLRIARLVEHAEKVIDRPLDRTYAGPCDRCGHDLYVEHGRADVICYDCGLSYDLGARREWLLHVVHDRLATAVEIARALTSLELSITTERIRQWKHRGRLIERGHDRQSRPLYRVGDVVDLLIEQQQIAAG